MLSRVYKYFSISFFMKICIFSIIFLSISCNEKTINYSELNDSESPVSSSIINVSNYKTFQDLPSLGSLSKLYFGTEKGTENLYSLIKLNTFSGFLPPLSVTDMLAESVVVDSALIFFQTTETLDSDNELSLFSINYNSDNVFSADSTNYYNLSDYINYEENATLLQSISLNNLEPNTAGVDTLEFLFKDEELDFLLTNFFDTNVYPSLTLMLKTDEGLSDLFTLESHNSANAPKMKVWFKTLENEEVVLDTFTTFFSNSDITIFKPQEISNDDQHSITLNSASGLKSIVEFDMSSLKQLSKNKLIYDANLILNVEDKNFGEDEDFIIIVSAIQDDVSNWNYSSFLDQDQNSEQYYVNPNFFTSSNIDNDIVQIPLRSFLQGYKNDFFTNDEILIYGTVANSPFDKIRLSVNSIEVFYVNP
tara:strand:+ start:1086 stop:2348 length:1263 start_codon:yes stop_codon:yes gene_type:complete